MNVTVFILVIVLMIIGLLGTIVPLLPGIPLIYLGFLIYGFATHWSAYGLTAMIILGIITVASQLLDYYSGMLGAKKYGATKAGMWGAFLGSLVGLFALNLIGLIVGPIVGAIAGELIAGRQFKDAWKSGWGSFLGFLGGSLIKIILAFIMIGMFMWWVF